MGFLRDLVSEVTETFLGVPLEEKEPKEKEKSWAQKMHESRCKNLNGMPSATMGRGADRDNPWAYKDD